MCHRNIRITAYPVLVMVALAIGILSGCSEYESNTFESYVDAKESGIIGRGWIPEFIPKSAYDIKEQHKVDVAVIDVEFKFNPGDVVAFESACSLREPNTYVCDNYGYPVRVGITGGNHAVIKSVRDGT